MTEPFDPANPGDRELERRLEAFADLRLTPETIDATRVRRKVMARAHRQAAIADAHASPATGLPTVSGRGSAAGATAAGATAERNWTRPVGALTAALMTMTVLFGTAAATRPGGPLYASLLTAERLTLPGETTARIDAETQRLDNRLREATMASADGDPMATAAALIAYSAILREVAEDLGSDRLALTEVQHHIANHMPSLASTMLLVPEPGRATVEAAIFSATRSLHGNDGT